MATANSACSCTFSRSITVKTGDEVKQGQQLGKIGFAGDTIFPHLHYRLMLYHTQGLLAYFQH